MLNYWPALLGWPAILLSLGLAATAIARGRPARLYVAALLITPMSLYVAGAPRIGPGALLLPLLLVGAGVAVRRSCRILAWSLLLPVIGFYGWLAIIVIKA